MIILDYNGVAMAGIFQVPDELDENLIRHVVLNSIRFYRKKFRAEYGEMVIAVDHGGSWRREIYPEYKANRKVSQAKNPEYWEKVWSALNMICNELKENFPYKVVHVWKCEADDVIATLCETTQEFGSYEKVIIISADKDFSQLQKWDNIKQFCPRTKKFIVEPNPRKILFEHICRGDGSDGVPNILSDDKVFVEARRQTPLRQDKLDAWAKVENPLEIMPIEVARNFQRNEKMIDLSFIPEAQKQDIINTYENATVPLKNKVMPYLVQKRCRKLLECIGDFL